MSLAIFLFLLHFQNVKPAYKTGKSDCNRPKIGCHKRNHTIYTEKHANYAGRVEIIRWFGKVNAIRESVTQNRKNGGITIMRKRKGNLLQGIMASLLSAVLITGMALDAVPLTVLAQENSGGGV